MTAFDFLAWAVSGSFWRFAGAAILIWSAGAGLSAGVTTLVRVVRS